jgi:hypothetical protein
MSVSVPIAVLPPPTPRLSPGLLTQAATMGLFSISPRYCCRSEGQPATAAGLALSPATSCRWSPGSSGKRCAWLSSCCSRA